VAHGGRDTSCSSSHRNGTMLWMWENDQLYHVHWFVHLRVSLSLSVCVCVCVCLGLYIGPAAVEMMLNEQMYCAPCHLSISPSLHLSIWVSPQIDESRYISHHGDKVECGMTGISNLHHKQWNSNYQPAQTISPAVTFGPRYRSIIHRHSCLAATTKKENGKKNVKEAAEGPDILILV